MIYQTKKFAIISFKNAALETYDHEIDFESNSLEEIEARPEFQEDAELVSGYLVSEISQGACIDHHAGHELDFIQPKFRYFRDPNDFNETTLEIPSEDIEKWYNGFGAVVEGEGEVEDEDCYFLPVDPGQGLYRNIVMRGGQYAQGGVITLTYEGEPADITEGGDPFVVYTYSDGANFRFVQLASPDEFGNLEEQELAGLEVVQEGEWDKGAKTDIVRCGDRVFERTEYQFARPTELVEIEQEVLAPVRRRTRG